MPPHEKQRCPDQPGVSDHGAGRGSVASVETLAGLADVAFIKSRFAPLAETTDELCAVARDVKADARDIHLGEEATEREIKRLSADGELAKYRMVHFATPGVLAEEVRGTQDPGLVLTLPDVPTEEDGASPNAA